MLVLLISIILDIFIFIFSTEFIQKLFHNTINGYFCKSDVYEKYCSKNRLKESSQERKMKTNDSYFPGKQISIKTKIKSPGDSYDINFRPTCLRFCFYFSFKNWQGTLPDFEWCIPGFSSFFESLNIYV